MADIEIKRIARREAEIRIVGTAPLIVHRFDEKARGLMLDAQQGRKKAKEPRDPEAEAERALHRLPDGSYGFPATGFKAATVGGSRYFNDKKLSQVLLKQAIFVVGEGPDMLVRLDTNEPKTREDVVRIGMGTANLCYRPMFGPVGRGAARRVRPLHHVARVRHRVSGRGRARWRGRVEAQLEIERNRRLWHFRRGRIDRHNRKSIVRITTSIIESVLTEMYERRGSLRPADIVSEARAEDHRLHECFEWDDSIAADRFRLFPRAHSSVA